MKTLKQHLIEYSELKHWSTGNDELYDTLVCFSEVVCEDNYDEYRWYTISRRVIKVAIDNQERFFETEYYNIKTESSDPEDYGFEIPDIDDIVEVFPHKVMTTIYK